MSFAFAASFVCHCMFEGTSDVAPIGWQAHPGDVAAQGGVREARAGRGLSLSACLRVHHDGLIGAVRITRAERDYLAVQGLKDPRHRVARPCRRCKLATARPALPQRDAAFPRGIPIPDLTTLDYSAICGVARIVGIVTKSRSKRRW